MRAHGFASLQAWCAPSQPPMSCEMLAQELGAPPPPWPPPPWPPPPWPPPPWPPPPWPPPPPAPAPPVAPAPASPLTPPAAPAAPAPPAPPLPDALDEVVLLVVPSGSSSLQAPKESSTTGPSKQAARRSVARWGERS